MFVAEIAPQVDRLVWTVNGLTGQSGSHRPAYDAAGIGHVDFSSLGNLVPVLEAGPLPESTFLLRYRYRDPAVVREMIADLVRAGCLDGDPGGYTATARLHPVMAAIRAGAAATAAELWADHEGAVDLLSGLVRRVLDDAPAGELFAAYRHVAEPEEPPARLHQRLAILRLVRNEAHALAWASRGLTAADMVVLTALWNGDDVPSGQAWSGPPSVVSNGKLTEDGAALREEIEADTNVRNEPAFSVLSPAESAEFLGAVTQLPGTPP
jgi:hypothetical protein